MSKMAADTILSLILMILVSLGGGGGIVFGLGFWLGKVWSK